MRKVLITGVGGMDGSHMADKLIELGGYKVYGTERKLSSDFPPNIYQLKGKIGLVTVDLMDEDGVGEMIKKVRPDVIFHFAAASYAGNNNNPWPTIENNMKGQLSLHLAIQKVGVDPLFIIACSGHEYGDVGVKDLPIDEETDLKPANMYGLSKVGQDMLGATYFALGQKIIRARPFNHAGPRRGGDFVESAIAKQIVDIENGGKSVVKIGNTTSRRDWLHVSDVIEAYLALAESGKVGEVYNIGSGVSHSVQELLSTMLSFSKIKPKIETDESKVRKVDEKDLRADISKIKKDTGWQPRLTFEKMCEDTLNWWREQS